MWKTFKDYIFAFITIIAAVITVIAFTTRVFNSLEHVELAGVIFLGVLCIYYLIDNLVLRVKWARDIRYGECLKFVDEGFQELHALARDKTGNDNYLISIMEACNYFAEAFTLLASCKCSIAVKILVKSEDVEGKPQLQVRTLCRDRHSAKTRWRVDEPHRVHQIQMNTDYANILDSTKNDECFFCNRLPLYNKYRNSSFEIDRDTREDGSLSPFSLFMKCLKWPLPYKSTIVVPICPGYRRTPDKILGFLCVCSSKMGAFKEKYDVELFHGMAEGLYNIIRQYKTQVEDKIGSRIRSLRMSEQEDGGEP